MGAMRSFDEIPRLPISRLLRQIFAGGAGRYEMREMQARVYRELGPVAVMGRATPTARCCSTARTRSRRASRG
jgi:hypothetical protein